MTDTNKEFSRNKQINIYITEHFGRVSNANIGEIWNITEQAVYCRVERLKAKKLIKKSVKPFAVTNRKLKAKPKANKRDSVRRSKKNSYSNEDGVYKQEARNIMKQAIKVHGKILSLPFSTCELEKQILADNPNAFTFVGCEYESDTFAKMFQTIQKDEILKSVIEPYYGEIGDKIFNAKENEYSNLILDYCGILDTFSKEIKYTVENNIVGVGGAICVTLSKRNSAKEENIFKKINKNIPSNLFDDSVGETERAIRAFFMALVTVNSNYSIEEFFPYQDIKMENGKEALSKTGNIIRKTPMVLFVLRRNK